MNVCVHCLQVWVLGTSFSFQLKSRLLKMLGNDWIADNFRHTSFGGETYACRMWCSCNFEEWVPMFVVLLSTLPYTQLCKLCPLVCNCKYVVPTHCPLVPVVILQRIRLNKFWNMYCRLIPLSVIPTGHHPAASVLPTHCVVDWKVHTLPCTLCPPPLRRAYVIFWRQDQ